MENIKLLNGMEFEKWYREREKDFNNITYEQTCTMITSMLDSIGNLCETIVDEVISGRRYVDDKGNHMKGYLVYNSRAKVYVCRQKIITLIRPVFSISISDENNPLYQSKYDYNDIGYGLAKNIADHFISYVFKKAYEYKYITKEQYNTYIDIDDWYTDDINNIDD